MSVPPSERKWQANPRLGVDVPGLGRSCIQVMLDGGFQVSTQSEVSGGLSDRPWVIDRGQYSGSVLVSPVPSGWEANTYVGTEGGRWVGDDVRARVMAAALAWAPAFATSPAGIELRKQAAIAYFNNMVIAVHEPLEAAESYAAALRPALTAAEDLLRRAEAGEPVPMDFRLPEAPEIFAL